MKVLVIFSLGLVLAQALPRNQFGSQWDLYKESLGKEYGVDENHKRFSIFEKNIKKIAEHNERFHRGEVSYKVNINQFSDMLESEVEDNIDRFEGTWENIGISYVHDGSEVADAVDWRNKGAVTPVKNQEQCGSSSIFCAVGAIESQQAIKTGKLVALSEQNIIDCDTSAQGCIGGFPTIPVFEYVEKNGGIDTEESYPSTGGDGPCRFSKKNVGAIVTGIVTIPQGDENALMNAIANVGPVSANIDASQWSFQMYAGGVYDEPNCSSTQLDHGVLIVGYGTDNGKDYWIVKNSWGASWGEQGYIKMRRNANNQCGIATFASYPTV